MFSSKINEFTFILGNRLRKIPTKNIYFKFIFRVAAEAFLVELFHVRNAGGFGDRFEEFFGHVARALLALVAVEELDEAPAFALFARGEAASPAGIDSGLMMMKSLYVELDFAASLRSR